MMARSTFRSVSYDLDSSLALAGTVASSPRGAVSSHELATALGYSGARNGAFLTRLANARLFGLVSGGSDRIVLTERGRSALSTDLEVADPARVEAFLAVPLYRAVLERSGGEVVPPVDQLAHLLESDFGESPNKAHSAAVKLVDSAGQAGLIRNQRGETSLTSRFVSVADFTDFTAYPRPALSSDLSSSPQGRDRQSDRSGTGSRAGRGGRAASEVDDVSSDPIDGAPKDDEGLWLEDEGAYPPRRSLRRRAAIAVAAAVCVAVVAVPLAYAVDGAGTSAPRPTEKNEKAPQAVSDRAAVAQVLSALGVTTAAGNFAFSYSLNGTQPTTPSPPTTTTTIPCPPTVLPAVGATNGGALSAGPNMPVPGTSCSEGSPSSTSTNTPVTGGGTIDVNPTAMVTTADVGSGGLNVIVRVNDTDYWEESAGSTASLAPPSSDGAGGPLSSFAGLVESTLGTREGAVAMLGMASPSGYLDLDQQQVTSADQVGTGTAGGVPVTIDQVDVSPAQEAQVPGASSEEMTTINAALSTLQGQGYTGTTVRLSVDGEGYIREADSTAHFSDGGAAVLNLTLSDFGCAGTVLTPGQQGSGTLPSNCTSPVPPTTTTTAPAPAIATAPSTTSTTVQSVPPSTELPPSTSSTTTPTTVPSNPVVPPTSTVPSSTSSTG